MDETSITAAQARIDAKAYPPTHDYDLATLTPRGPLAERVEVILRVCPSFWSGQRFFDVGCSKGFFSLKAQKGYDGVVSIEPDYSALEVWEDLIDHNLYLDILIESRTFAQCAPRNFGTFDMIWIGNGHHYLYRDDHSYISMLAKLATDRVVIEGPVEGCPDLKNFGDYQTEAEFLEAMSEYFVLMRSEPSPPYTPGRKVWGFRTR